MIKNNAWFLLLLLSLMACKQRETIDPVAETFELNVPAYFGPYNDRIPEDNPITEEGFQLGRKLFYEPRLSKDNTMTCSFCHQQEKAFTDRRAVSIGVDGLPGKVSAMSLVNLMWSDNFTWNGKDPSIEEQALEPIQNPIELHQSLEAAIEKLEQANYQDDFEAAFGDPEITSEKIGKALAQFERALISANSKYDQYLRGEYQPTASERRGIELFYTHPIPGQLRGGNCGDCHLGPRTSGALEGFRGFHNNGIDSEETMDAGLYEVTGNPADSGKFKAPSLRNIAITPPYMHDGRFKSLEEVLDHYNTGIKRSPTLDILLKEGSNEIVNPNEPVDLGLTDQEKEDIIAFLHMLTDEDFVSNPRFSNPFTNAE
ncbi:cytochrome-c peroxidase [Marivirga atlantica]|jgi:cytochrome c peroxidase|uniref:Cytochrome-c peroxidase n=1 Tax=Marivirga atlantica TaxID=1548457 RepID=A0A937DIQ4_9BACT|nr:cytochrome c peroxidase [Marivirga atlantica]MBL0765215.1 cytochrome-c peroxidase [Marivirga atlantica]